MPRKANEKQEKALNDFLFSSCTLSLEDEFSAFNKEKKTTTTEEFSEPLTENTPAKYDEETDSDGQQSSNDDIGSSEEGSEDISDDDQQQDEPASKKFKAAWSDDDDDKLTITHKEGVISGKKYQLLLQEKYTAAGPAPAWADLEAQTEEAEDSEDEDRIQICSNAYVPSSTSSLAPHHLKYSFVSDLTQYANKKNRGHNHYKTIFAENYPLALVTRSTNKTKKAHGFVSLFQVGADQCHELDCFVFEKFPINSAAFLASSKQFIVGARHCKHMYLYDLDAAKETKIPWKERNQAREVKGIEVAGDNLVIVNEGHSMTLLDTRTWRPVGLLRPPSKIGGVAVSADHSTVYSHGREDGQVHIWDVRSHASRARFPDEGCVRGTAIAVSPDSRYLACGADSGVVNVYSTRDLVSPKPRPSKIFDNLVTRITTLSFNHSSEALVFASPNIINAVRMAHFPSRTVMSNFPALSDPVDHVHHATFSPHSGYLAVSCGKAGQAKVKRVRLQQYGKY